MMLLLTMLVGSFANSSASLVSYALVVFLLIFPFASPMLVAQCCKKKTAVAKGQDTANKPKVFGPADDVLLCKTQNETTVVDADVQKPAAAVAPQPVPDANKPAGAAVPPSPAVPGEVLPKSKEKTCLPATTNVATVVPDPELKTRNVSLETVESREPQSVPVVKASDKFINKGGGIFVDKDNKAISQYAPAPQNNG